MTRYLRNPETGVVRAYCDCGRYQSDAPCCCTTVSQTEQIRPWLEGGDALPTRVGAGDAGLEHTIQARVMEHRTKSGSGVKVILTGALGSVRLLFRSKTFAETHYPIGREFEVIVRRRV